MKPQLRCELLKQRTTPTNAGLLAAMVVLVAFVVTLHGVGLPAEQMDSRADQRELVFGWGELLGAVFSALVGAMSITGEFRHGTIRPTLLVTPRRARVLAAKLTVSALVGAVFGLLAAAVAVGVGNAALRARGIDVVADGGGDATLVLGGAAAAALWAAIGVGVGAALRHQVPVLVGICTWLLFIESVLVGDSNLLGDVGRFTPGALAKAASGQEPALAPGLAVVVLGGYAATVAITGWLATTRRDVA